MDKLVARFADGRVLKGTSADVALGSDAFRLLDDGGQASTPTEVRPRDLKALFGVKDFAGDPTHVDAREFDGPTPPGAVKVVFEDGEVLVGTTTGLKPDRAGFFVIPADPDSNNVWCYIMAAATREVCYL